MNIGEQIAKYRKERHLTQEQLGEAVGVTNRTVSKWEASVSSPGVDLIPSIASALGISLDQLFGEEKQKDIAGISETIINDIKLEIADAIENAINDAMQDIQYTLSDALYDALSELLPKYLASPESKDDYSLLVISHDKSTVCRFYGQGYVSESTHNVSGSTHNNNSFFIIVPAQGGNVLFPGYQTKEAAAEALESITKAYTARFAKIEL